MNKIIDHVKNFWYIYIAIGLYILGMHYYSKAYGCENYAYEYKGSYYTIDHPKALKQIDTHFKMMNTLDAISKNNKKQPLKPVDNSPRKNTKKSNNCYDECTTNAEKARFHKTNAERTFNDAKDKCWYLPKLSERDKARYCFTNIGAIISNTTPQSKIVVCLVTSLIQYGIDCSDEWNYINNKLYWSQYHYEMMEFHLDLIKNGYP